MIRGFIQRERIVWFRNGLQMTHQVDLWGLEKERDCQSGWSLRRRCKRTIEAECMGRIVFDSKRGA